MELSRILRVLITLILVVAFIGITVAAYRQNQKINSMTTLSDAASSIVTRLSSRDLAWVDEDGDQHPYIVNLDKLKNLGFNRTLAGENFQIRVSILLMENRSIGPYGGSAPEDRMTSSIEVPVVLLENRKPAKLRVIVWYA